MPAPDLKKALEKANQAAVASIKAGEEKAARIAAIQEAIKKEKKP